MGNVIWEGDGTDIPQVDTVVLALSWAANDTIDFTISDKVLTLTVGTDATLPVILDNLLIMISGSGTFGAGYSSNFLGNTVGEFQELVATEDGVATLTLTAVTPGTPFTLNVVETTAGSGTATESTPTANSSKNDWNNTQNWDTGVVPVNADDVLFENSSVSVLHGLNQSAVTLASLTIRQSYEGEIGLPETNVETTPFAEYRGTFLQTASAIITIGEGDGTGSGRIKIDSGSTSPVVGLVRQTGASEDTDLGSLLWKGSGANVDWDVNDGEVGFGMIGLTVATIDVLTTLAGTIRQSNGTIATLAANGDATLDLSGAISSAVTVKGGTATLRGDMPAGKVQAEGGGIINLFADVVSALTDMSIFPASTIDLTESNQTTTVSNAIKMFEGATLLDPNGTLVISNGVQLVDTDLAGITLDLGREITVTPS